jgi:hypothetical protein
MLLSFFSSPHSLFLVACALYFQSSFKPAAKFCRSNTDEPCSRPDLFAFQVSSAIMQVFMGFTGVIAWHISKRAHLGIPATPEGRLFGYLEEADRLNAGILVFQVWDFVASLSIPEHATAIFLTHHALAALTAWFSLKYQFVHYYAIYFGGCSEFSSIFLVLCDFDVYFPTNRGSLWGGFIFASQVGFTVTFFYYRVIGWWKVSYQLWSDVLHVLKNDIMQQYRPGKTWFLYVFLVLDLVLGLLQVYWFGFGILPKIMEILVDS